ncbi:MAG: hypothetical protein QXE89_08815 [Pyrobaculum sp.]
MWQLEACREMCRRGYSVLSLQFLEGVFQVVVPYPAPCGLGVFHDALNELSHAVGGLLPGLVFRQRLVWIGAVVLVLV